MGTFLCVACVGLLAAVARAQCVVDTSLTVASTEDAATLAASLGSCSSGEFTVQWTGGVAVAETILVAGGTSLNITGAGSGASADGGGSTQLFALEGGSSLHLQDMTLSNGDASGSGGGAISAHESSVSFGGIVIFLSNSADTGGAIYADNSTVFWDGDSTKFVSNSARVGGAIHAVASSSVTWNGNDTEFVSNSAKNDALKYTQDNNGGAIAVDSSKVYWHGDRTLFLNNTAFDNGGAIHADTSYVEWDGDGTRFISNSAGQNGGAIFSTEDSWLDQDSRVLWNADRTQFISNTAGLDGGAITLVHSSVLLKSDGTLFSYNSAGANGGAIGGYASYLDMRAAANFSHNRAGVNGGAIALNEQDDSTIYFQGGTFFNNSADSGGAVHVLSFLVGLRVANTTVRSNSARLGGAVTAVETGSDAYPVEFEECIFSDNEGRLTGGAVEVLSGRQDFLSCDFEGNSAAIGGAMRLAGSTDITECSFLSNHASSGPAVALALSANISDSAFDGNELLCAEGSYRSDQVQTEIGARFQAVCSGCDWDQCSDCAIARPGVVPECEAPLEHTTANESGLALETLNIDRGYWRAINESNSILACYNPDACEGGQTGAASFCASGYTGPYCSVCEEGYAPSLAHVCTRCSGSRRLGLIAVTVIATIVAAVALAFIFQYLSSAKVAEEGNTVYFHQTVLRAVPVQALKIGIVVWQILTQFADAANATYPGVYQDFLSVTGVVNLDLGSMLAAGCLWPDVDFHDRLLVSTMGPLVVVGFLAMTYRIALHRNSTFGNEAAAENIRRKHQKALLLVTFLVYSGVSSMILQSFASDTLDDGITYLRADYRIRFTDTKHRAFQAYAGIMIFVYPIGIPLLYATLLFKHRDVLADGAADKSAVQPIAGLYEAYRPERFYYEVIECGRRITQTGLVVFIFPDSAAQIAIAMLIALFFFVVFDALAPYKSESDTWISRVGHVIVFLSMFDLLLLKVDVSNERDQGQAAFAGVLVACHVLLILAFVIEVAAICYWSRKEKASAEEGQEASERPRAGSDDGMPVFESAPAAWRWFLGQSSVSVRAGPTRNVPAAVSSMDGRSTSRLVVL